MMTNEELSENSAKVNHAAKRVKQRKLPSIWTHMQTALMLGIMEWGH